MSRYGIDWDKGSKNFTSEDYEQIFAETSKIIAAASPDELLSGAFYDRAIIHYGRKDYEKAISDFTCAIKLCFKYLEEAYYARGLSYYSIDNYDAALSDFTDAVRIHSNLKDAWEMIEKTKFMLNKA